MRAPEGTPMDAFDHDDDVCDAFDEWFCTRPAAHEPPHVATEGPNPASDWLATWTNPAPGRTA